MQSKPLAEAIAYWRAEALSPEARRHMDVLLQAAQYIQIAAADMERQVKALDAALADAARKQQAAQ